jgi:sortase A
MSTTTRVAARPLSAGRNRSTGPRRRRLGWALVVIGALLVLGTAANFIAGLLQEHSLDTTWQQWRSSNSVPSPPNTPNPAWLHPVNGIDFAISVPKLRYFAAVREGVGADTLLAGPGHYPGMAWPGQVGNVGVAAHNVYWIHFDELKPGDEVDLQTRWGDYRYAVTGSKLVWPDDRTVLVPTTDRRLTLTTCWPLWAGAFAWQRLIIFAEQTYPSPGGGRS